MVLVAVSAAQLHVTKHIKVRYLFSVVILCFCYQYTHWDTENCI